MPAKARVHDREVAERLGGMLNDARAHVFEPTFDTDCILQVPLRVEELAVVLALAGHVVQSQSQEPLAHVSVPPEPHGAQGMMRPKQPLQRAAGVSGRKGCTGLAVTGFDERGGHPLPEGWHLLQQELHQQLAAPCDKRLEYRLALGLHAGEMVA